MSTGAIIGIIIAVIVVIAVVVFAMARARRSRIRRQFGPEYDRMAKELGSNRKAEAELTARKRRVEELHIHPLTAELQAKYTGDWTAVQERFVDTPADAVSAAGRLVWDVMRDRGYPADNRDRSIEALSVYHARALDGYRQSQDMQVESATTEQLREAMIRYRELFDDLIDTPAGEGRAASGHAATAGEHVTAENNARQAEKNNAAIAENNDQVADNNDRIADSDIAPARDTELTAENRDLAAENADHTADTPR